jgi:6-phosphofructokinase 1
MKGIIMKIKGNLLYGQSGGPSSVINSSAYGVISQALKHSDAIDEIYCATYGIQGVIDDKLINVSSLAKEEIELLKQTPGAAFGSCRHKLTDFGGNDFEYQKILDVFKKHNIRFFLYNGGNDSMDTCSKIADFMKKEGYECYVIGIPKTIDNDLAFTDHTPGYGSAAKYIANTVLQNSLRLLFLSA